MIGCTLSTKPMRTCKAAFPSDRVLTSFRLPYMVEKYRSVRQKLCPSLNSSQVGNLLKRCA